MVFLVAFSLGFLISGAVIDVCENRPIPPLVHLVTVICMAIMAFPLFTK